MKTLSTFFGIIDRHTIIVTVLAVAATHFALVFNWAADIPTTLIGIAVIFPIVFSIQAAWERREQALRNLATMKAHALAIYYAHRDWVSGEHALRAREEIIGLLQEQSGYLAGRTNDLQGVYDRFSSLSASIEQLRQGQMTTTEVSRTNQYLSKLMVEFEMLRNIRAYRTPVPLRAYSQIFLNSFPIAFAPYFAFLSQSQYRAVGYIVAVLYSLVLVSLDNIQEQLENPFDSIGVDDVELSDEALLDAMALPRPVKLSVSAPA